MRYSLLISFIAGLSTLIGYLFIYFKKDKNILIPKLLAFSGGVMITLSLIDLIPSSLKYFNYQLLYFIIPFFIGYFLSHTINTLINEGGLYKTGIISMIGIILHNIPEGIATFTLSSIDIKLGLFLSIAIILHNIPEGISIAIPIYYSTNNKLKTFFYTLISGLSEPFGALITLLFLNKYINNTTLGILFSIISGLMIYIGYYELIKTSIKYNKKDCMIFSLIGSLFIIIVEILLKF